MLVLILTTFYKLLFFDVLLVVKRDLALKHSWNWKQTAHLGIHQLNACKLKIKKQTFTKQDQARIDNLNTSLVYIPWHNVGKSCSASTFSLHLYRPTLKTIKYTNNFIFNFQKQHTVGDFDIFNAAKCKQ